MDMATIERYNNIVNDELIDDGKLKWKLSMSRMDNGRKYTKKTWISCGRFRFDIEYHSDRQFFYVFCRYDNNNRDHNNGCNRTVTLWQLRVNGNKNEDVYNAIEYWKNDFSRQLHEITQ